MSSTTARLRKVANDGHPPVIRLQGIGYVHAKPAGELHPGDITLWNYGNPATVKHITRKGRYVTADLQSHDSGQTHSRRMLDTRLVGVRP